MQLDLTLSLVELLQICLHSCLRYLLFVTLFITSTNKALGPASRKVYSDTSISRIYSVYAIVMLPGQTVPLHLDVPEFHGIDRSACPNWLLVIWNQIINLGRFWCWYKVTLRLPPIVLDFSPHQEWETWPRCATRPPGLLELLLFIIQSRLASDIKWKADLMWNGCLFDLGLPIPSITIN